MVHMCMIGHHDGDRQHFCNRKRSKNLILKFKNVSNYEISTRTHITYNIHTYHDTRRRCMDDVQFELFNFVDDPRA
ncbi:hypothetical protein HanIR_Chr13g0649031 [Helianthus annuus]|nr:hypothetical protein HanIR_Chr13g0649031 [Helianthus annuus]